MTCNLQLKEIADKLPKMKRNHKNYYIWYSDDNYLIAFSNIPDIHDAQIHKQVMDKEEIKKIEKKPLILRNEIDVILKDCKFDIEYKFSIPKNYTYDGATIPSIFWKIIGSKENINFKIAALIHDVLCENHDYINNDRYFSTMILERLLFIGNTPAWKRWFMKHSVDNFQKIFGGW